MSRNSRNSFLDSGAYKRISRPQRDKIEEVRKRKGYVGKGTKDDPIRRKRNKISNNKQDNNTNIVTNDKEQTTTLTPELKQQEDTNKTTRVRQYQQVQIYAQQQQNNREKPLQPTTTVERTPEQEAVIAQGKKLLSRQKQTIQRIERAKNLYRIIPGLRGNNAFQRGAREFLFIINPGTAAPALGETLAGGVDSIKYIRDYRRAFGKEQTPSNLEIAKETAVQTSRVLTLRDPQTGEFTAESIGGSAALILSGVLGARGVRGSRVSPERTTSTTNVVSQSGGRVRSVSVFEEGGVPRATGDLPPGIKYADVAPRSPAPSLTQARRGVPVEYTFETINGRVQYQTRLGKGGSDPAQTITRQLIEERFGGVKETKRFPYDTAGRDPRQTTLSPAVERGVRTESGSFIDRIPTSEQVIRASNLKPERSTGRQTVIDSYVNLPKRKPTAQEIIDQSTPNSRSFLGVRGRRAQGQVTILRRTRSRPNPNKVPFKLPSKGEFINPANELLYSLKKPEPTQSPLKSINKIRSFVSENKLSSTNSLTEQSITLNIGFDQPTRPAQEIITSLKPKQDPIQETLPIVRPRRRTRSGTIQKPKQDPIQETPPINDQENPQKSTPRSPILINNSSLTSPPKPPEQPPYIIPPIRIRRTPRSKQQETGYNVLVRRQGKFLLANTQPLTKQEAINYGAVQVGTTAAATFKIVPAGSPATARFRGRGLLSDFEKRPANTYVEKASRRIKSFGELQEITFKGIVSKKTKKKKNPLLTSTIKFKLPRISL